VCCIVYVLCILFYTDHYDIYALQSVILVVNINVVLEYVMSAVVQC